MSIRILRRILHAVRQYFAAPIIAGDEEKTRVAALVNTILVVFTFNAAFFAAIGPFVYPEPYSSVAIFLVMLLARHGMIRLMRRGHVFAASLILSSVLWIIATFLVFMGGGIKGPHVFTYITTVLIAGLLVGGRAGISFALLSIATGGVVTYLNAVDILPHTPLWTDSSVAVWVIMAANLVIVAVFQYLMWNSINQALQNARHLAQEAVEANAYKTRLLARVSHELRNPMGAILGLTEMLNYGARGSLTDEQQELTERVIANVEYLRRLIAELLDQSRIESGQLILTEVEFSPEELIQQVCAALSPIAVEKGLALTFDIARNMPTRILGDRDRIEQIVSNLVSNALKFTERGIVAVNAFRPAGVQSETYWALQIADSGIGIPPEAQARVFEPFWQLEQSPARRYGGVGLGLAIVKQLTDLMGGQIKLESEVGRGSTFTVVLPLKKRST